MVLPQALTEHLRGVRGVQEKASSLEPKEGFGENTEIARSREEENPSSSKFTTRGRWSMSKAS